MPRTGQPATRQLESVSRAVQVLTVLARHGPELGTNEIARRTGINASTVSRLLATLDHERLVAHQADSGRYRLGVGLLALAAAARESLDLRALARPLLVELRELTGETTTLGVPGRYDVLTVDFVASRQSVRSVTEIGRNSAAHATAVGKVFLAHGGLLPDGALTRYTSRTVVDRAALTQEVAEVRRRGWAQARGEREEDLAAAAVPVLDPTGALVAVLGVQGPALRFDEAAVQDAVGSLTERAHLLAAAL